MTIKLPTPHEPFVEKSSGKISDVWYRQISEMAIKSNSLSSALAAITTASTISISYATQTDQEASTAAAAIVTPSVQQYHPSAAKVWGTVTLAGTVATVTAGYNVNSAASTTIGILRVNLATGFATTNYCVVAIALDDDPPSVGVSTGMATTSFLIITQSSVNPAGWMFTCYGDQ